MIDTVIRAGLFLASLFVIGIALMAALAFVLWIINALPSAPTPEPEPEPEPEPGPRPSTRFERIVVNVALVGIGLFVIAVIVVNILGI